MTRSGPSRPVAAIALVALASLVALSGCAAPEPPAPAVGEADAYVGEIEQWRVEREEKLRRADGWLTLIGLFWLQEGANGFGSDPELPIALPEDAAPKQAGTLTYDGRSVWLESAPGVELTVNDEPVTEAGLRDDLDGSPDVVRLGRLMFYIITRDGKSAVRVKDPESPGRHAFEGLEWFPVDPAYRVVGRLVRYDEPEAVEIPTAAGTNAAMLIPGKVEFELGGSTHSLLPLISTPEQTELFFILRDGTSGKGTYGSGRYLYGDLVDGEVVLDFNKAYNPPCVFTPYATCPLPPSGNRLKMRVEAGEKDYGHH